MKRWILSTAGLAAGVALAIAPAAPAHSADGRDFAGFYEAVELADRGEDVEIILRLWVSPVIRRAPGGAT